jgi:hypothetical protein
MINTCTKNLQIFQQVENYLEKVCKYFQEFKSHNAYTHSDYTSKSMHWRRLEGAQQSIHMLKV